MDAVTRVTVCRPSLPQRPADDRAGREVRPGRVPRPRRRLHHRRTRPSRSSSTGRRYSPTPPTSRPDATCAKPGRRPGRRAGDRPRRLPGHGGRPGRDCPSSSPTRRRRGRGRTRPDPLHRRQRHRQGSARNSTAGRWGAPRGRLRPSAPTSPLIASWPAGARAGRCDAPTTSLTPADPGRRRRGRAARGRDARRPQLPAAGPGARRVTPGRRIFCHYEPRHGKNIDEDPLRPGQAWKLYHDGRLEATSHADEWRMAPVEGPPSPEADPAGGRSGRPTLNLKDVGETCRPFGKAGTRPHE